ncbi:hypothetical protein [Streptomyces lavendofoliae]|uniref:hypothetical protein n=1 Tax=Streptomyces lavendofoliae TaxID=67314 RepID=UPI00300E8CFD
MIKQVLAAAGVAAAVLGASSPAAFAVSDREVHTQNGNFSTQSYGNTGSPEPQSSGRALTDSDLRPLDGLGR